MNFLFPIAAWLGLLALPIVALYLLKTRQRRKKVSTLLFWSQLKPKIENSPFWRKLRRWISLALQLLIFAFILLALMHPAFEWEQSAPRRIVAILDNSASMQAESHEGSRWERARERLDGVISRLRLQDEMALLTAEDPPRIVQGWTSSKRELRAAIQSVSVQATGSDPRAALSLASELVTLRENAQVEVFSDAVWPSEGREALNPDLSVLGVEVKTPENAGLTLFAIRRSPVAPGEWQLDAEVTSPTAFTGTLELRRDGQPLDLTAVRCEPGKLWRKSWRGTEAGGALFEGFLKNSAKDELALDNQAAAKLAPLKTLRVLVVGSPDPFLEAVLSSIPLVQWSQEQQFPTSGAEPDLVITHGGTLPTEPILSPLLLLDPPRSGFWGERAGTLEAPPISDVNKKSPLLRHTSLNQVAIDSAGKWKPADGCEVLVASLGDPLIFGQWDRTPRWLVVGFDPGKSDLRLRTAFPILMGNLLESLRNEEVAGQSALLPGRVESELQPILPAASSAVAVSWGPVFPGWWWVLLGGLLFLVAEWALFHRRLTD